MIGIFDSGVGGINVLGHLRVLMPRSNVIFLRDRKNCPYGTKSRAELIEITERNIAGLKSLGADKILIACCTASAVFAEIDHSLTGGVVPTVPAVAEAAAAATECGNIALIATEATVSSHIFQELLPEQSLTEIGAQSLVTLVERGGSAEEAAPVIHGVLSRLSGKKCDTLILGCTHFSSLKEELGKAAEQYGVRHIIDSARVSADALYRLMGGIDEGLGLTYHLST